MMKYKYIIHKNITKQKGSHGSEEHTTTAYNGEIFPAEQYAPKSEEHRKIYQGNYKHYEDFIELLSKLNPPLDKRFIEIMDEQLDVIPYEFSEMFIDGFKLGAKIMAEVFRCG